MHISFTSILAVAVLAGLVSAKKNDHKEHKHKAPKGKAFDHILQIWFENTVNTYLYYGSWFNVDMVYNIEL